MARKLKCPICGDSSEKDQMIFDEKKKRYYHKVNCYDSLLRQREFTDKENSHWDNLYQYIKDLHHLGVVPVPDSVIVRIQNLRAGFFMKNGKRVRQWKNGPPYDLILEAYQLAEDKIKQSVAIKFNGDNSEGVIHYGISIMIGKLLEAQNYRKKKAKNNIESLQVKNSAKSTNEITTLINEAQSKKNNNNTNIEDEVDLTTLFD